MIVTFRNRPTEQFFLTGKTREGWQSVAAVALRKLDLLSAATSLQDLKSPPGNHLEALSSPRKGQYSIRINNQWRLCFRWSSVGAHDVEITDYHKG